MGALVACASVNGARVTPGVPVNDGLVTATRSPTCCPSMLKVSVPVGTGALINDVVPLTWAVSDRD